MRDSQNRVLLVRTAKLPGRWQPAGGGIEEGESPTEAAIREILEETNISLVKSKLQLVAEIPYDFGVGTIYFFQYKLPESLTLSNLSFSKKEIIDHEWFYLEQTKSLPLFDATSKFLDILSNM